MGIGAEEGIRTLDPLLGKQEVSCSTTLPTIFAMPAYAKRNNVGCLCPPSLLLRFRGE